MSDMVKLASEPSPEIRRWEKSRRIAYAKGRARGETSGSARSDDSGKILF
jgi:hypothetical protein